MPRKKHKKPDKALVIYLQKHWWIIVPTIIFVGWLLYMAISTYVVHSRFDATYRQLDSVYQTLAVPNLSTVDRQNIERKCRNLTPQFGVTPECDVRFDGAILKPMSQESTADTLTGILTKHGFVSVDVKYASETDRSSGTAVFYSENGMRCGGYWTHSDQAQITLYCRERVPNYLSGYMR